jgi:hypothetical protein
MASSKSSPGHHCCSIEHKDLVEALRVCDYCATSYKEHHACYKRVSKESGRRGRACLYS